MESKKVILITGASRGIGRATAIKMATSGTHILINYQSNIVAAEETKCLVELEGATAELLPFNVNDAEAVDQALDLWHEQNPELFIDTLVNNAGIRNDTLMMWMSNESWESVLNTSLNGFFYCTRRLLKNMLVNKKGNIVNVVSLSGIKGQAGQVNYSAAKSGVIGATKALAQEVGKKGVRVNAVAPGFIMTDMTEDLPIKDLKKMIPLNRFGKAEEVADAISFLASSSSSYITGEVLSINGGLYT
ncbi:3-oxoacyl-ACP reductase FabG [Persicobacter psychrovividus]|uniref:3-ketoacyl-ACP reductase n=1 Tax=Persicobacter psychrovividus TaxID=387638 RepID=A0ABN6LL17_9BACT|nr:3-ketoacyl-ACP reductase [Persicobacter psychrovividus]